MTFTDLSVKQERRSICEARNDSVMRWIDHRNVMELQIGPARVVRACLTFIAPLLHRGMRKVNLANGCKADAARVVVSVMDAIIEDGDVGVVSRRGACSNQDTSATAHILSEGVLEKRRENQRVREHHESVLCWIDIRGLLSAD